MPPQDPPQANQVLVRMYGQGVGDCFLLSFPRTEGAGGRPVYVVVDCGVIGRTPDADARMRRIVRDIRETTGAHLDLLIVTHEHWDHVGGFFQAEEEWRQIQVDALWLAWTEGAGRDSRDDLPDVLKKILEKQRRALVAVADRAERFGLTDAFDNVLGLLAFVSDAAGGERGFGVAQDPARAFNVAKALVPERDHAYCEPGEVRRLPGTQAVAYVLGPPRDGDRLRQLDPSQRAPETYEAGTRRENAGDGATPAAGGGASLRLADLGPEFSLRAMAGGRSPFNAFAMPLIGPPPAAVDAGAGEVEAAEAEASVYERSFPFDRTVRVPLPLAEAAVGDQPAAYAALASYFDETNHWRRIDFDWLAPAEEFALRADSLTNNTSLVLAFELPPAAEGAERKVLLFTGDAQVGNWLSWDDIPTWQPLDGADPAQKRPDIADLLKRTVFYKVGHHGSHNATLKARGVERMRKDGTLTSFVPVSPIVARQVMDWCHMPLDTLLDTLSQREVGQVVLPNGEIWRPQAGGPAPAAPAAPVGVQVSADKLPAMVRDGVELQGEIPLWVQIAIPY
jgi:hypothetical protein